METHLAFVFSMWPRSQTEEKWVTDSLAGCGVRTREGASRGHQHASPPPRPWESALRLRGGTELTLKSPTQHLKDKATRHVLFKS